jgi:hypothetical protein
MDKKWKAKGVRLNNKIITFSETNCCLSYNIFQVGLNFMALRFVNKKMREWIKKADRERCKGNVLQRGRFRERLSFRREKTIRKTGRDRGPKKERNNAGIYLLVLVERLSLPFLPSFFLPFFCSIFPTSYPCNYYVTYNI